LWLYKARTWISNAMCRGLFCVEWIQQRCDVIVDNVQTLFSKLNLFCRISRTMSELTDSCTPRQEQFIWTESALP
jgi:hypothetical protein